jgi:hypothetical protein
MLFAKANPWDMLQAMMEDGMLDPPQQELAAPSPSKKAASHKQGEPARRSKRPNGRSTIPER